MYKIILKIARLSTWTLVLLTIILSEILTITFSSIQSILLWGYVPLNIVFIGAVDAFLVAMPLSYAIIQIIRFSARTHLEKAELKTEVDARIRIEEGLQHSLQQLQLVTDNVSDVFWTMDRSGRFEYVSPSVQRMFGYTPEEALNDPHAQARQLFKMMEYPGVPKPVPLVDTPVRLSKSPGGIQKRAPVLGEHTEGLLTELGYGTEQIAAMRKARVV